VQIMAVLALRQGAVAEMATGEGKTLTAGMAAVLAAWRGWPCHVVTANDYLVARDAQLMTPLFTFCGVSVGYVTGEMNAEQRRAGYAAQITYATGQNLLADFLRDQLAMGDARDVRRHLVRAVLAPDRASTEVVMRGLGTAIIDEADSVLVDEAITPLIIAFPAKNEALREGAVAGYRIAAGLERDLHYHVDAVRREVRLLPEGRSRLEDDSQSLPGLWRGTARREDLIRQALLAKELYHRDQQYAVIDDEIVIVDEFTGRLMPGRTWNGGLHQAIEVKEGVPVTDPTEVRARMSFQHYYRHYPILCGMTGTARGIEAELWGTYKLPVIRIPTHRPCQRRVSDDVVFNTTAEKWQAIADDVAVRSQTGQPVLVGTRSIDSSEDLARMLAERGIACQVLNALRLVEEADIIANAGQRGTITIATNMAGRGTDIALGEGVAELGGLHVVATERHVSRRVDLQLFGRSARQGDPGSAATYLSLQDDLPLRMLPHRLLQSLASLTAVPRGQRVLRGVFAWLQTVSERNARRQRWMLLQADIRQRENLAFAGVDNG
jgi:preprotein translocase subunit SecA